MDVLKEILNWSQERPIWQRDALRRLVLAGDLLDNDISELTKICKSVHGLTDEQVGASLGMMYLLTGSVEAGGVVYEH